MKTSDKSILREIEKSKGYDVAIFTTYNFEVDFFEKYVLSLLSKNNIRSSCVFIDAKQLNEATKNVRSYMLGREYYVTPVELVGAFHPKIIMLIGENKAKLIISSANIKTSGYIHNNEIYNVFEYTEKDLKYSNLFVEAKEFLIELFELGSNQDSEILKLLQGFEIIKQNDSDIHLISNLREPILKQLEKTIENKVYEINIATPFFDKTLVGLKRLLQSFDCKNVNIYLQNAKNTFPYLYNKKSKNVAEKDLFLYETVKCNKSKAFYHGKVIELKTKQSSYILYGSANCTSNALIKTYSNNGNVECCILVKGEKNNNDKFFKNFDIDNELDFQESDFGGSLDYTSNYNFIYGSLEGSEVILYINYGVKKSDLLISLNTNPLEYKYNKDYLEVYVPYSMVADECIFEILIKSEKNEIPIVCWYNNQFELIRHRTDNSVFEIEDFPVDDDSEKYAEYKLKLYKAMYLNTDWLEYGRSQKMDIFNIRNVDDIDEEELNDNYILDSDITDAPFERKQYSSIYKNALAFSNRFYKNLRLTNHGENNSTKSSLTYPEEKRETRAATSSEKRLARFFKRNIKILLATSVSDVFSYEYYKHTFGVILDSFERLYYREKIEDFLDLDYILDVKLEFAKVLLSKAAQVENFNDLDELIDFVLTVIVERTFQINAWKDDESGRLLYQINKMKNIREDHHEYIKRLNLESINMYFGSNFNPYSFAIRKVDDLFGYKTENQLLDLFKSKYGNNVEFIQGEDYLININLPYGTKASDSIPHKQLQMIAAHINEYSIHARKIIISFREQHRNRLSRFVVKHNGGQVGGVNLEIEFDDNIRKHRCGLYNGVWRPNYFDK